MKVHSEGVVLKVSGRFDGRFSTHAREVLYGHIAKHPGEDVVVDLSDVAWIDVTALQVLAGAARHLERQERHLVLRGCQPTVRRVIRYRSWRRLFHLESSDASA